MENTCMRNLQIHWLHPDFCEANTSLVSWKHWRGKYSEKKTKTTGNSILEFLGFFRCVSLYYHLLSLVTRFDVSMWAKSTLLPIKIFQPHEIWGVFFLIAKGLSICKIARNIKFHKSRPREDCLPSPRSCPCTFLVGSTSNTRPITPSRTHGQASL